MRRVLLRGLLILPLALPVPGWATCLTPAQARDAVPLAEHQTYDDIQDLTGAAYLSFRRILADGPTPIPDADEIMVFHRPQIGPSAEIGLVWFNQGCAVQKGSYPMQFWQSFVMQGKPS